MFKWLQDKLPSVMDELDRFTRAEDALNGEGVLPPVVPNRMACAPNPRDMLEAFNTGMDLGESITENAPRVETQTMDQFVDSMGASLFMVSAQLWKDTTNLKNCMNEQDIKHEAEMKEYIEQVKEVAKELPAPRPAPVTPQFVWSNGHWVGPQGVIQDHYDPSNCGGGGCGGGGGGDGNGIDHGPGGSGGGGGDLMNIDINCGGGWESNGDGTLSCKGP